MWEWITETRDSNRGGIRRASSNLQHARQCFVDEDTVVQIVQVLTGLLECSSTRYCSTGLNRLWREFPRKNFASCVHSVRAAPSIDLVWAVCFVPQECGTTQASSYYKRTSLRIQYNISQRCFQDAYLYWLIVLYHPLDDLPQGPTMRIS